MTTRARDSDRNDTCQILDSALADGQLSMEEHLRRVSAATKATTLGELHGLVTDLQVADASTSITPVKRRGGGRVVAAAAIGAVVVVGVAIGWGVFGGDDARTPAPVAEPAEPALPVPAAPTSAAPRAEAPEVPPQVLTVPKQLHTVDGMTALLDTMRQRFGDTTGVELAIFPDHAMLFRPDPNDDRSKLLYSFRGGWGDPTRRPRDDDDLPADLGAFDVNAVVEVLRGAPEMVGMNPADVSEVVVDIDQVQDPAGPAALELLVMVSGESGGDGYIYLDSAGNTKRVEYPS